MDGSEVNVSFKGDFFNVSGLVDSDGVGVDGVDAEVHGEG